jgi:small subunit ribosomal protein S20
MLTNRVIHRIVRGLFQHNSRSRPLANSAQARKRARQGEKRRRHNAARRSLLRTRIKQVVQAIEDGDKEKAQAAYQLAVPVIDTMAGDSIIHKNKAARHKSRLNTRIRALA